MFTYLDTLTVRLKTLKKDIEATKASNKVSFNSFASIDSILLLLQMMLGVAINCEVSDSIVGNFTEKLDELALDNLMQITKDVLSRFCKKDIGDLDLS